MRSVFEARLHMSEPATSIFEWVLAVPALIFILVALFYMIKFNATQKGASLRRQILVAWFGPFLLASSNVISDEAKYLLKRFYVFSLLFVVYLGSLLVLASVL
mgnify:CR=1 FL=1